MDILIELLKHIVSIFLMALQVAMTLRAILSWFVMGGNKLTDFLYAVTEPFIYPIRSLFERMNWLQGTPIDFSFMITYLLISLIALLLG